jgi:uncharacterized protein
MTGIVLDASVVGPACGWTSEAYLCLTRVARRRARSFVTVDILDEWRLTLEKMEQKRARFRRSPWPTLEWLSSISHCVEPALLGKQRSRDPNDDPYLACALAARAEFILSYDPDLLDLEKPFGIAIVTPRQFLNQMVRPA